MLPVCSLQETPLPARTEGSAGAADSQNPALTVKTAFIFTVHPTEQISNIFSDVPFLSLKTALYLFSKFVYLQWPVNILQRGSNPQGSLWMSYQVTPLSLLSPPEHVAAQAWPTF